VAQLRAQGADDLVAALRADAPDGHDAIAELAGALGMRSVRMQDLRDWRAEFASMPFTECVERRCALFVDPAAAEDGPRLVVTDPFDTDLVAMVLTRAGTCTTWLASVETFEAWLVQAEVGLSALGTLAIGDTEVVTPGIADAESLSLREIGADASPAVRFINSTLYDALKIGASDIHLESDPGGLTVKFRIDGVLTTMRRIDGADLAMRAISRIKVMAQLDIAERRVPQDGRLQIAYNGRSIDVRVSIMPSIHGEDAVLRILDREHLAQSLAGLTLAKLGFDDGAQAAIRRLCGMPHGMLLVTGPTGSGKTTTLYAAIAETHQSRDKIITIEDPVEYQLPGVLQIPVNERKGLTFARGLRSILRHDPDKILVGEIRDAETAQIAVQSALTGHLVFTTVHANTVFDVVGRFDQFGIDTYTFASAVNGVLAQRLVRRLCPECSEPDSRSPVPGYRLARGCERCRGTGYSGRFALGELLTLTSELKALVARRAPHAEIQAAALATGWASLRDQALHAASLGLTTLEEVDRVAV
jgi:general secretion pathway protein E